MCDYTYNLYSLILALTTLLVTGLGLYAVYHQIIKTKEVVWSNLHSTLCSQSFELIKLLKENPELYDYFYKNKSLASAPDETIKNTVLLIAEAFGNFMEQLVLQKDHLPEHQERVWHNFIIVTLKTSAVVGDFIVDHCEWYADRLVKLVEKWQNEHTIKPTATQ